MSTPDDTLAGLGWPSEGSTADHPVTGTAAGLGWPTAHTPTSTTAPRPPTTSPLADAAAASTDHSEESA